MLAEKTGSSSRMGEAVTTFSLILEDMHPGERTRLYDPELASKRQWDATDWHRVYTIWDALQIEDVRQATGTDGDLDDDDRERIFDALYPGVRGPLEAEGWDSYSDVIMVTGTYKGLRRCFRDAVLAPLKDELPSGDDDFFDYWPNTMMLAWNMARNLDDAIPQIEEAHNWYPDCKSQVHELARWVWDQLGQTRGNPKFEGSDDLRQDWVGYAWMPEDLK